MRISSQSIAPVALAVVMSGCAQSTIDIDSVKNYAKTVAAASDSFEAVAKDYYLSCVRQREYALPLSVAGGPFQDPPLPSPEPEPTPSPGNAPPMTVLSNENSTCGNTASISNRWRLENIVVTDYVRSIGEVAGVDTAPKNFDALATSLKNAGALKSDAVATTAGSFASALVDALIKAKREHTIVALVQAAQNNGFDTITDGLMTAATTYRDTELTNEGTALNSYYTVILTTESRLFSSLECSVETASDNRNALHCHGVTARESLCKRLQGMGSTPNARKATAAACDRSLLERKSRVQGVAFQLRDLMRTQRQAWYEAQSSLRSRVYAGSAYVSAMKTLQSTHDKLVERHTSSMRDTALTLKPYVDELADKVSALYTAIHS